jgi:hypothetical protein
MDMDMNIDIDMDLNVDMDVDMDVDVNVDMNIDMDVGKAFDMENVNYILNKYFFDSTGLQRGYATWSCSTEKRRGLAAWKCSVDMHRGQRPSAKAWTYRKNIDMQL